VSLVDLMPTLMDLIGLPIEDAVTGLSLVPLLRGEELPDRLLFAEYGAEPDNWAKSVWDAHWRYTEIDVDGRFTAELFDRLDDPREERDVSADHPDLVEFYSAALDLRFGTERRLVQDPAATPAPLDLDPAIADRLRALGYVDVGGDPSN
jgi:arylsulfatase A-like enzyme